MSIERNEQMNELNECVEIDSHDLEFIESKKTLSEIRGFYQCTICGAYTKEFYSDLRIDDELISEILSREAEDELFADDDDRISQGLK